MDDAVLFKKTKMTTKANILKNAAHNYFSRKKLKMNVKTENYYKLFIFVHQIGTHKI